jgi:AcrR family transcriptional regulator
MPRKKSAIRNTARDTRELLLAAAATEFNRHGYHGTDSNQIARAAGYAPGTFYKHFADKREVFHAAYERWVTTEWGALADVLAADAPPEETAAQIVEIVLELHRRWRVFRASLRALTVLDPVVREFRRGQLRRQLELIDELRHRRGARRKTSMEAAALMLLTMERVCDALADGEAEGLGVQPKKLTALLVEQLSEQLR